jgi:UDP-2,3-diacylglucosamine hydrolase
LKQKLYCISDAHLGAHRSTLESRKKALLHSFLSFVLESEAELLICGDLFDFWFEYKYAIPKLHFPTLSLLNQISKSGRKVHYLAGNHDFWLGDFLENEIGLVFHKDDYAFEFCDKKYFVHHGDGLYKNDHLYRALKKILRNPINIYLYRLIHPDLGIPLALRLSHQSRETQSDKSDFSDLDFRLFAYDKITSGYDYVILGHTHWPALDKYKNGWYLNAGNWIEAFTYLEIDNLGPKLWQWDGKKGVDYLISTPPGNIGN